MRYGLSKSKVTAYEQCPKKLWLTIHRPEVAERDDSAEMRFAAGHDVGLAACAQYPRGIMVEVKPDLKAAVEKTACLLKDGWRRPIFEATFVHDGVLVRSDLMFPARSAGWHVAEVKSSTGVKPYYLGDIATQVWVLRESGVKVASARIRHLNRDFRLTRADDYAGLFKDTVVHSEIAELVAGRAAVISEARAILDSDEPPREMGDHCHAPFACEFQGYCGRDLPPAPEWPASLLPDGRGKKIAQLWAEKGVGDLTLIPLKEMVNAKLRRVYRATVSGKHYRNRSGVRRAIADWAAPRHFLDFETIAFPVPRWLGTGPWQQVPFQFSCHTQHPGGRLEHREFLSLDGTDPRRPCAKALVDMLCSSEARMGSIVAYNASFERRCIKDLAELYPDLRKDLEQIIDRIVDLLPVARENYYHRDQRGSWSIKAVLPTICAELDYGNLGEVKAGGDAQAAYLEAIHPGTAEDRRLAIRSALLAYCERDTLAMVELLERLSA